MASAVKTLCVCLFFVAFAGLHVDAQADRTAEFQAFCDKYQTQLNDCEQFLETTQLTDVEQTLVNQAEKNEICLVEGDQNVQDGAEQVADACEILETICARAVTCPASARFRRSASASTSSSVSAESSEASDD